LAHPPTLHTRIVPSRDARDFDQFFLTPMLSSFHAWDYVSVFLSLASAGGGDMRVAAKIFLVNRT
jgi:hypothetical protein